MALPKNCTPPKSELRSPPCDLYPTKVMLISGQKSDNGAQLNETTTRRHAVYSRYRQVSKYLADCPARAGYGVAFLCLL